MKSLFFDRAVHFKNTEQVNDILKNNKIIYTNLNELQDLNRGRALHVYGLSNI